MSLSKLMLGTGGVNNKSPVQLIYANKNLMLKPGVDVHTNNPSTWEDGEFEASLGYIYQDLASSLPPKVNSC
jgi:hypothetical protein